MRVGAFPPACRVQLVRMGPRRQMACVFCPKDSVTAYLSHDLMMSVVTRRGADESEYVRW